MSLKVKKLSKDATIPTRGSEDAAGLDLYAIGEVDIAPGHRALVGTGIAVQIPRGYYGRIAPRSGLAAKYGIDVFGGVVDSDYRGEVKVILVNSWLDGANDFNIVKGDRIAQLIIEKIDIPNVIEVDELDEAKRGDNGFGSTGI